MGVSAVMSGTSTSSASSSTGGSSIEDISNNFMTLLIAQMQNQDPTNPLDNSQLTSQLAQFNTASGVQQLNATMNNVGTLVTSMQQMNAAQWVGRSVLVEGNSTVSTGDAGNSEFAFALSNDADRVTVTLTDPQGNAYTADLKDVKAGVHKYSLDDLSNFQPSDPTTQPDATFKVTYTASTADGDAPTITSLKKASVDSVSFTSSGAVLQLGLDGTATLGQVYLIE